MESLSMASLSLVVEQELSVLVKTVSPSGS